MKRRLFIGSSTEKIDLAYAAQENLEHDFEVTVWTQGLFDPSKYVLDGLVDVLDDVDFGIFIFSPDDISLIRGESRHAVRDNVLFELGLFIGRLGRESVFLIVPRGVDNFHLPSDLLGITPATYEPNRQDSNLNAALGPACNKIKKAASRVVPAKSDLSNEINAASESFDENDIVSLIESWLGSRSSRSNSLAIRFSDVDREIGLTAGSAKKFIEIAARRWRYIPARKGNQTITFRLSDGR